MAIETTHTHTCDRCGKERHSKNSTIATTPPKPASWCSITLDGVPLDLCESCRDGLRQWVIDGGDNWFRRQRLSLKRTA